MSAAYIFKDFFLLEHMFILREFLRHAVIPLQLQKKETDRQRRRKCRTKEEGVMAERDHEHSQLDTAIIFSKEEGVMAERDHEHSQLDTAISFSKEEGVMAERDHEHSQLDTAISFSCPGCQADSVRYYC